MIDSLFSFLNKLVSFFYWYKNKKHALSFFYYLFIIMKEEEIESKERGRELNVQNKQIITK